MHVSPTTEAAKRAEWSDAVKAIDAMIEAQPEDVRKSMHEFRDMSPAEKERRMATTSARLVNFAKNARHELQEQLRKQRMVDRLVKAIEAKRAERIRQDRIAKSNDRIAKAQAKTAKLQRRSAEMAAETKANKAILEVLKNKQQESQDHLAQMTLTLDAMKARLDAGQQARQENEVRKARAAAARNQFDRASWQWKAQQTTNDPVLRQAYINRADGITDDDD
jgi:chromosome segregation ATPase